MAERRHESADLEDYEVLDSSDTLAGPPGDDPLDRGVATPEHWSRGVRFGTTSSEQHEGQSLDDLLAAEEPDAAAGDDWAPEPADDQFAEHPAEAGESVGRETGIDSGAATAEEAAVHVLPEQEEDVEPGS